MRLGWSHFGGWLMVRCLADLWRVWVFRRLVGELSDGKVRLGGQRESCRLDLRFCWRRKSAFIRRTLFSII